MTDPFAEALEKAAQESGLQRESRRLEQTCLNVFYDVIHHLAKDPSTDSLNFLDRYLLKMLKSLDEAMHKKVWKLKKLRARKSLPRQLRLDLPLTILTFHDVLFDFCFSARDGDISIRISVATC